MTRHDVSRRVVSQPAATAQLSSCDTRALPWRRAARAIIGDRCVERGCTRWGRLACVYAVDCAYGHDVSVYTIVSIRFRAAGDAIGDASVHSIINTDDCLYAVWCGYLRRGRFDTRTWTSGGETDVVVDEWVAYRYLARNKDTSVNFEQRWPSVHACTQTWLSENERTCVHLRAIDAMYKCYLNASIIDNYLFSTILIFKRVRIHTVRISVNHGTNSG